MTANKYYMTGYIGGRIKGCAMTIQNASLSSITMNAYQGIFYVFEGREYPLLTGAGQTIASGQTITISKEIVQEIIPSGDTKLMISTGDLTDCIVNCTLLWEVE